VYGYEVAIDIPEPGHVTPSTQLWGWCLRHQGLTIHNTFYPTTVDLRPFGPIVEYKQEVYQKRLYKDVDKRVYRLAETVVSIPGTESEGCK
jgi:hypothetical protein